MIQARFNQSDIERVKLDNPISEVVGRYVTFDRKKSVPSRGDFWACCPFHGEKSPSFHCEDKKDRYYCFGCGASGDQIKFIQEMDGLSFSEAMERLGGIASDTGDSTRRDEWKQRQEQQIAAAKAEQEMSDAEYSESARKIFQEAAAIKESPAEIYLNSRIGEFEFPASLRFHPSLFCRPAKEAGLPNKQAALVAAVQSADGKIIAIWREFVTADGQALCIDGSKVKLGFGPAQGGVVRLGPVQEDWNVGEGLISTLGAMALSGWKGSWASSLSTSGMKGFEVPDGVKRIHLWTDGDRERLNKKGEIVEPGGDAGSAKAKELENLGFEVLIHTPPRGTDWADVWENARKC